MHYSIQAGDLAYGQYTFARARNHYQVAAELLEELDEESDRAAHVHAQLWMDLLVTGNAGTSVMSESARRGLQHIHRALETFVKLGNICRALSDSTPLPGRATTIR